MQENQTIFRVIKDKNNPYTNIHSAVLRDHRLSWKAKGIMAYLLSLPDDWRVYQKELVRHSPDGLHSLRSGIKELKKYGYLKSGIKRDESGKFEAHFFLVFETPEFATRMDSASYPELDFHNLDENNSVSPECGFPKLENPISENHTLLNTESTKYLTDTNNLRSSRQRARSKPKREEEADIRDWIIEHVPEAKGKDTAPIKNWLKSGAKFEDDIKPAVLKAYESLKKRGQKLGSLHYFDTFVENTIAARLNPKPKRKSTKSESMSQQRQVEAKPLEAPKKIPEFKTRDDKTLSWREVCQTIKRMLGEPKYISWIVPLTPESYEKGVVTLRAGSRYVADNVSTLYQEDILAACENQNANVREVRIVA